MVCKSYKWNIRSNYIVVSTPATAHCLVQVTKYTKHRTEPGDRRGRDRMVVRFTTTYVISAYHH
jgi:hypothetical protein